MKKYFKIYTEFNPSKIRLVDETRDKSIDNFLFESVDDAIKFISEKFVVAIKLGYSSDINGYYTPISTKKSIQIIAIKNRFVIVSAGEDSEDIMVLSIVSSNVPSIMEVVQ